jgi:poly(hydroxyalkanoate) depolymerase family esterase
MQRTMQESMRLIQTGDLAAATRAIQQGLGGDFAATSFAVAPAAPPFIEGEFRVESAAPQADVQDTERDIGDRTEPATARENPPGTFTAHRFTCTAGTIDYKLFLPAGPSATPAPLLLMLHGCTQSPDDFARGTRMNQLAQQQGYVVAYPAQAPGKNPGKCWNWFRSGDQRRGAGEPALLTALAQHLVVTHALDAGRVYVAGLSAGGAMAAVLANAYPDVFAAIGVHSGLPAGVAHDMPSALAVMKQGAAAPPVVMDRDRAARVPAIVFHGDRDGTVHPRNGASVVMQATGSVRSSTSTTDPTRVEVEPAVPAGGRLCTRTVYRNQDGTMAAEEWVVHGAGHAWFGGDPAGSYADAAGPDASTEMLRFFTSCRLPVTT